MRMAIRKTGNSQGVLIPKLMLAQIGLEGTADLQVGDGVIEIRAIRRNPREGWAAAARRPAGRPAGSRVALTLQGKQGLIGLDQIRPLDRMRLGKRLGALRKQPLGRGRIGDSRSSGRSTVFRCACRS